MYEIKCNTCGTNFNTFLYKVRGLKDDKVYPVYKCKQCDLVFTLVNPADLKYAYESEYYKNVYPDYETDFNAHRINNDLILNEIEKYFEKSKLLEIGSAFGFFLVAAKKRGWKSIGYELSEYSSEIAKNRYHVNVENKEFLNDTLDKKFDVACYLDTIEHLIDPNSYIEKTAKLLKKNGGIYITTGNINSLIARITGKKWRLMKPPFHLYYYSEKSISNLLKKHGFSIIKIEPYNKFYNLGSIVQFLFQISKKNIPYIPIRFKFSDVMSIIARYNG